ncbi:MAG: hypothetical protein OXH81_27250, partial [Gemmatimonadetes bacterium]|nr:hypothetical protein [Gemmatimonadota bacterium]
RFLKSGHLRRSSIMKKSKKSFDAVHTMRQLRDRLNEQCKDMTFEEQKRFIRARLSGKPIKVRKEGHE